MMFNVSFSMDFGLNSDSFFRLLSEEDYDFRSKDIRVDLKRGKGSSFVVEVVADSVLNLKIAVSAVIKSLEIISKSLEV